MKFMEKISEGAGIALTYAGGVAALWFGGACTLLSLIALGIAGFNAPVALILLLFGVAPLGTGFWLFRRGKLLKEILRVKLQKELVRKAAFQSDGRLTPKELASAQGWSVEHALNVLKNLAAEDPERMTLQLDYDSGEVYFEFADILLALQARRQYQALPISDTLGQKAVELATTLGKTLDAFNEYVEARRETASQQQHEKREDQYRAKVERFLDELDALKRRAS